MTSPERHNPVACPECGTVPTDLLGAVATLGHALGTPAVMVICWAEMGEHPERLVVGMLSAGVVPDEPVPTGAVRSILREAIRRLTPEQN